VDGRTAHFRATGVALPHATDWLVQTRFAAHGAEVRRRPRPRCCNYTGDVFYTH
jgi:hypothetical protein